MEFIGGVIFNIQYSIINIQCSSIVLFETADLARLDDLGSNGLGIGSKGLVLMRRGFCSGMVLEGTRNWSSREDFSKISPIPNSLFPIPDFPTLRTEGNRRHKLLRFERQRALINEVDQ
jgi:hypothetical protein